MAKSKYEIELEQFKAQVRDRILEAIDDGTICRDGGYDAMTELGLEKPKGSFDVTFYAAFRAVDVAADSESDTYSYHSVCITDDDCRALDAAFREAVETAVIAFDFKGYTYVVECTDSSLDDMDRHCE